jgi:hypothetical protein
MKDVKVKLALLWKAKAVPALYRYVESSLLCDGEVPALESQSCPCIVMVKLALLWKAKFVLAL